MIRKCLKEYYIILGRIEKVDWLSKEIIFDLLSVDSKETLDYLVNLDNDELREALEEIGENGFIKRGEKVYCCYDVTTKEV